jgi:hypothetical protein
MTPMVDAILTLPSEQSASTPQLCELDEALTHAGRTAGYFVRQRTRDRDAFFVQEMRTEAYFIVTQLILTPAEEGKPSLWQEILCKYPDKEERFRFYRMTVGYGLKEYIAWRSARTLRYLRSKGFNTTLVRLEEDYVPREDNQAMMNLILAEAANTPMERSVLEFYCMGNSIEVISQKVGLEPKRVKKVMRRIKRRLKKRE